MPAPSLLFLTLSTFSTTGGIEKVCRIAGKALHELATERGGHFRLFSMYDAQTDVLQQYIPPSSFTGFAGRKFRFAWAAVSTARHSSQVVLSHINLLAIGLLIKLISPKTRVVLIAHGIEVWVPLSAWKMAALKLLDDILPVSAYTRQRMIDLYGLMPEKLTVVNNCLDPFLTNSNTKADTAVLREKFGLNSDDKVLLTLARLSFSEQYKGYDKVIALLPEVIKQHPSVKYLIAGKWDKEEKTRLDALIDSLGLEEYVVFTGFVADRDIPALFNVAEVYVMPSTGEGFGIVFIEALFYGLPVIAGNQDGSVDALAGGQFGRIINPAKPTEIIDAIQGAIKAGRCAAPPTREVVAKFGFNAYKAALAAVLHV